MGMFYHFSKNACNVFCSLWFRVKVSGMCHIPKPKQGGFIIIANHRSYFDPVMVGMRLKNSLRYMAKAELFEKKLLGWLLRHIGVFPVRRGTGDQNALQQAVEVINNGEGLVLFPEGTRSKTGELMRFKSGVIMIAIQTGADIIPCAVSLPDGKRFRGRMMIRYGEPVTMQEFSSHIEDLESPRPKDLKAATGMMRQKVLDLLQENDEKGKG